MMNGFATVKFDLLLIEQSQKFNYRIDYGRKSETTFFYVECIFNLIYFLYIT